MTNQLSTAIYTILTSATTLPVYDHVPDQTQLPYVTHSLVSKTQQEAHFQPIYDVEYQVNIYSNAAGYRSLAIEEQKIVDALHQKEHLLVMNLWKAVICEHESSFQYDDISNNTRNIAITFKLQIYKKTE